jgi:hypothetical protein
MSQAVAKTLAPPISLSFRTGFERQRTGVDYAMHPRHMQIGSIQSD